LLVKSYKILELNDLAADALSVLELNYPDHPRLLEIKAVTVE
jgi:outer membrane protein assembly factor BamD